MFCFQCEQTAGGKGCMGKAGVCGKRAETADHQDGLVGALIALAQAAEKNPSAVSETTHQLILDGLFTTVTNVSFNDDTIQVIIDRTRAEKRSSAAQRFLITTCRRSGTATRTFAR